MTTLPLDALTAGLAAGATHAPYGTAAAVRLLIAHDRWLHRADFRDCFIQTEREYCWPPVAWVHWHAVPAFLECAPCSTSEARILRLAASLAGYHCAHPHCGCPPLGDLLSGLDDTNAQHVADAIAHVVTRGGTRPLADECEFCDGSGHCAECDGYGQTYDETCQSCAGTGDCDVCDGHGTVPR